MSDKYHKPGEKINKYSILKMIGQGKYGIVYLVESENTEKFIIKQLKESRIEETKEKLFYEEEILKKLNSSKFPKFISNIDDNIKGYVLEYVEGKVFEDILFKEKYIFTRVEIYNIANQILDIINILHENNIVHRDIRPPNIILRENNELVLIDFGLARYIDNNAYTREMDYWYLGDFLIHLYYSSFYQPSNSDDEKPWFEELNITQDEILLLKKLMGIEGNYNNLESIKEDLKIIIKSTDK